MGLSSLPFLYFPLSLSSGLGPLSDSLSSLYLTPLWGCHINTWETLAAIFGFLSPKFRSLSHSLFRFLWFLAFHWHINFKIWILFVRSIWRFPLRCSFRGFSDIWFSIIHSKSISYPKITNYISINFIFSLVLKYIIFVIFWLCLILWFIVHLLLVKVNDLTLTFDFSLSNPRIKFLKLLI